MQNINTDYYLSIIVSLLLSHYYLTPPPRPHYTTQHLNTGQYSESGGRGNTWT